MREKRTPTVKKAGQARIERPPGLSEEVYRIIRSNIMTMQLPPDSRVSVDDISRTLGVSQTPVREALSMLEADGFVLKRQFAGYCTPPRMDRAGLDELFEFRRLVEPYLAGKAAVSMGDEDRAKVEDIIRQATHDHHEFAEVDADFHALIAHAAGNRIIAESLARLHIHIHIFRSCFRSEIASEAVTEHLAIAKAILAKDGEAAGKAMRNHIELSYQRLCQFIPQ